MEGLLNQEYWNKSIPVLIIGFVIWGLTSFLFADMVAIMDIFLFIILAIIYFAVWIAVIILTFSNQRIGAMCLFFLASFLTGLISTPVFDMILSIWGVSGAVNLFIIVTIIAVTSLTGAYLFGFWIKQRISEDVELNWGKALIISGILLLIVEPLIIIIFGYDLIIFWTSIFVLLWMYATGIFYGMQLDEEMERKNWMYFVLSYFLTLINIILRLLIILSKMKEH